MTVGRSKRRSLLVLTFIVKSISKNLLIRHYLCCQFPFGSELHSQAPPAVIVFSPCSKEV